MKKSQTFSRYVVMALLLLGACTVKNSNELYRIEKDEQVLNARPEALGNKQDVYVSMARAAKYNADVIAKGISEKIGKRSSDNTEKMLQDIIESGGEQEHKLYQARRALTYAETFAFGALSDNRNSWRNYIYDIAAQRAALAAIRVHNNAWFATQKNRELKGWIRQEQQHIKRLVAKEKQRGKLSDREYEYLTAQKVLVKQLAELKNQQDTYLNDYYILTKVDNEKLALTGRKFYELENFDAKYKIADFQEVAVENRLELKPLKEQFKKDTGNNIRHQIITKYPLVDRLNINGVEVENEIYEQELYDKAINISRELLNVAKVYSKRKNNQEITQKFFDILGAAIFTQTEINYQMVRWSDFTIKGIEAEIKEINSEIVRLKQIRRISDEDKLALLSAKINKFKAENKIAVLKAERATALRDLYFGAGLSPFNCTILKMPIADIATELQKAFDKDLVTMTMKSQSDYFSKNKKQPEKGWAQRPNWLEEAVKSNRYEARRQIINKHKIYKQLQLGAYNSFEGAQKAWTKLSSKYADLKQYGSKINDITLNGVTYYRLIVEGNSADLVQIGTYLQNDGVECWLK